MILKDGWHNAGLLRALWAEASSTKNCFVAMIDFHAPLSLCRFPLVAQVRLVTDQPERRVERIVLRPHIDAKAIVVQKLCASSSRYEGREISDGQIRKRACRLPVWRILVE